LDATFPGGEGFDSDGGVSFNSLSVPLGEQDRHENDGESRCHAEGDFFVIKDAENTREASFPMAKVLPQRTAVRNKAILAEVDRFILFQTPCKVSAIVAYG